MRCGLLALALTAATDARAVDLDERGLIDLSNLLDIFNIFSPPKAATSAAASVAASARPSAVASARPSAVASPVLPVNGAAASNAPSSAVVFGQPSSAVFLPPASSALFLPPASSAIVPVASPSAVVLPPASSVVMPVASSAAAALPSASGIVRPSDDYVQAVLDHHNAHRANHSAPAVTWSDDLYNSSLIIANTCVYGHVMDVNGGGYGQNIAAGMPTNRIGYVISDQFYNGEVNSFTYYGQPTPDMDTFHEYGHFTQVVWVGSTQVACASVDCSAHGLKNVTANVPPIYHVCNYGPQGNIIGRFDKNVLPSLNQPTIHG